jgi:hypothetical protein
MIGSFVSRIPASKFLRSKNYRSKNRRNTTRGTLLVARFCFAAILMASFQTSLAHAQLTQLYAFEYNPSATSNYPDGEVPVAELIQGADGNYYTTTTAGGSGACTGGENGVIPGCGAIVKITPQACSACFTAFRTIPVPTQSPTVCVLQPVWCKGRTGTSTESLPRAAPAEPISAEAAAAPSSR